MAHVRQQIRDRIASVLSTSATLVNQRVYTTRVYPLTSANLPAITVYTGAEVSNLQTMGARTLMRNLDVAVDIYVRATSNTDSDVDTIAVQVEEAIANDFTVNGLAKSVVLTGTDIDFNADAEQPIGIARLTFSVSYITAINNVETAK
tara:strand:+ start:185 stop:628 length:444 start_codon:yes stop_codon:yes gene_type:complete